MILYLDVKKEDQKCDCFIALEKCMLLSLNVMKVNLLQPDDVCQSKLWALPHEVYERRNLDFL